VFFFGGIELWIEI